MKKNNNAQYVGVKTNVLNNIDVQIPSNQITFIGGQSGSGKSSLAFQTIADISDYEFSMLEGRMDKEYSFELESYNNIQMVISLEQLNFNVNVKSSIMTYFGLKKIINRLINYILLKNDQPAVNLSLYNYCLECEGKGIKKVIDLSAIIESNKRLIDLPFRHWQNSYCDFYRQLLAFELCELNIDECKTFNELNAREKSAILYGKKENRYKIIYKYLGKNRSKTIKFNGIIDEFYRNTFNLNYEQYTKPSLCELCNGARFNKKILDTHLTRGTTVQDFLLMPFEDLLQYISLDEFKETHINRNVELLQRYLKICCKLGLSYLNLSRGITTLSGGEFQRLRLAKIFDGSICGITVVLDEPSSSLYPDEIKIVAELIKELREKNTVIIVDHNFEMEEIADVFYYLKRSEVSGKSELVKKEILKKSQIYKLAPKFFLGYEPRCIELKNEFVKFKGSIHIPKKSLVSICGQSGSGKSIILKELLPFSLDDYIYVSQKPIKGNITSSVGTYLGLISEIKKMFIKNTKIKQEDFQKNKCNKCKGLGIVSINTYYDTPYYTVCDSCEGSGCNNLFSKCEIGGFSYEDMLLKPIDEILRLEECLSGKLKDKLQELSNIGLGYLTLNRRVSTLSGGENQRIKLIKALWKKTGFIGLDEPCQGLDEKLIKKFLEFIYNDILMNGRTYIVAEHNIIFLKYSSYLIELVRNSDSTEIVYNGHTDKIKECNVSAIAKWL
ncbi:ATP-binding cassette domain-containing protein [Veillonella sp. VA139]|uniref:ATP-binding cassette domain-containing protein n=1 Tax=Veillonella sp. VA139 TaxID=741830 RepID=UPI000F8E190E|nr:ATP-binding cassette domain-containing protein [Veillonella sp. VA139]